MYQETKRKLNKHFMYASENGHTEIVLYIIEHHTFQFHVLLEQHQVLVRERLSAKLTQLFPPVLANIIAEF